MSVKPETLENPEQDLALTNRDVRGTVLPALKRGAADMAAAERLAALRQRIAAHLANPPEGTPIPECRACYRSGWMAALRSLED